MNTPITFSQQELCSIDESHFFLSLRPARSSHVWLVTFSDLLLLLLTFFVLLFAMSDIDLGRYSALLRPSGQAILDTRLSVSDSGLQQRDLIPSEDLGFLEAVITDALAKDARFGQVEAKLTSEYLVLSLPSSLLFAPGSDVLTTQAETALFDLASLLGSLDNAIAVSGHVGPTVSQDEPILLTWELSLIRAVRVSDSLRKSGFIGPLTVLGQSDTDYRTRSQLMSEMTKSELAATANRVDIVIFPHMSGV
ncbi:MAG: flagellar motor protein MotB [Rhodospirillaceae bacterium]